MRQPLGTQRAGNLNPNPDEDGQRAQRAHRPGQRSEVLSQKTQGKGNRMRNHRRRKRAGWIAVLMVLVGALGSGAVAWAGSSSDSGSPVGNLPIDPQWLANTLQRASSTASVTNNTPAEAVTRRNQAVAAWKQAEAAYNHGDFQQAAELFENAVRVEPSNVKAKLLLANAILRADSAQAPRARQQYLDALALESGPNHHE